MSLGITVDILGWLGALILTAGYGLISYGSVSGRSPIYQSLNLIGSVLLVVNTAWHHAWPSSAVNFLWVGIAIAALIRGFGSPAAGVGSSAQVSAPRGQRTTRE